MNNDMDMGRIASALELLVSAKLEGKGGFVEKPGGTWIFVNPVSAAGFFVYDENSNVVACPTNYIQGRLCRVFRFEGREDSGKQLCLQIAGDKLYTISAGLGSTYAKTALLVLSAATPSQLQGQITVGVDVKKGKAEKRLGNGQIPKSAYCNIYDSQGNGIHSPKQDWRNVNYENLLNAVTARFSPQANPQANPQVNQNVTGANYAKFKKIASRLSGAIAYSEASVSVADVMAMVRADGLPEDLEALQDVDLIKLRNRLLAVWGERVTGLPAGDLMNELAKVGEWELVKGKGSEALCAGWIKRVQIILKSLTSTAASN